MLNMISTDFSIYKNILCQLEIYSLNVSLLPLLFSFLPPNETNDNQINIWLRLQTKVKWYHLAVLKIMKSRFSISQLLIFDNTKRCLQRITTTINHPSIAKIVIFLKHAAEIFFLTWIYVNYLLGLWCPKLCSLNTGYWLQDSALEIVIES